MNVDAIVRVSFDNGDPRANQAANRALVGHALRKSSGGPFTRVGTAAYSCSDKPRATVVTAIKCLTDELPNYDVDYVAISIVGRKKK